MISEWEAQLIAAPWLDRTREPARSRAPVEVDAFDLGYVVWPPSAPTDPAREGAGCAVVDRETGELTVWPSQPVAAIAAGYRRYRVDNPAHRLTFDPVVRARRARVRVPFPQRIARLTLPDGRTREGQGMKGDATPQPHPLVAAFLAALPPDLRERGNDRCAEVAAISDELYAEDARRGATDRRPLTTEVVRDELMTGATIETSWLLEPGDPRNGTPARPCRSCLALLEHLGVALVDAPQAQR